MKYLLTLVVLVGCGDPIGGPGPYGRMAGPGADGDPDAIGCVDPTGEFAGDPAYADYPLCKPDESPAAPPPPCSDEFAMDQDMPCAEPDPTPTPTPTSPMCVAGRFEPGTWGSTHECYGVSSATGNVYALDRMTGEATYVCSHPSTYGAIEAMEIDPTTGKCWFISQDGSDNFGSCTLGMDSCTFTTLGSVPNGQIGGIAFTPEGELWAGDEVSGEIFVFPRAMGTTGEPVLPWEPAAQAAIGAEGITFSLDGRFLYVTDGSEIETLDVSASPPRSIHGPVSLARGGVETIFTASDGILYATTNDNDVYVQVDPDTGAIFDIGDLNQGTSPAASELEGSTCNTACTYDTCICR